MFIYLGVIKHSKRIGCVADYCVICHSRQRFTIYRIRNLFHYYGIRLWETKLHGHERHCYHCGQRYPAMIEVYQSIHAKRNCDFELLVELTNPDLASGVQGELQTLDRLYLLDGSPDDRIKMIQGLFHTVYPEIKERVRETHCDYWSGLWIVFTVLSLVLWFHLHIEQDDNKHFALALTASFFCVACYFLITDASRYAKRVVLPKLRRALAPLSPTPEEINAIAEKDETIRKILKRISVESIVKEPDQQETDHADG